MLASSIMLVCRGVFFIIDIILQERKIKAKSGVPNW